MVLPNSQNFYLSNIILKVSSKIIGSINSTKVMGVGSTTTSPPPFNQWFGDFQSKLPL